MISEWTIDLTLSQCLHPWPRKWMLHVDKQSWTTINGCRTGLIKSLAGLMSLATFSTKFPRTVFQRRRSFSNAESRFRRHGSKGLNFATATTSHVDVQYQWTLTIVACPVKTTALRTRRESILKETMAASTWYGQKNIAFCELHFSFLRTPPTHGSRLRTFGFGH